jgi:hypothetical protein
MPDSGVCSRQIAAVSGAVFLLENFGRLERDVPLISQRPLR